MQAGNKTFLIKKKMVVKDGLPNITNVTLKGVPTIEEVILARQLDSIEDEHQVDDEGKFHIS